MSDTITAIDDDTIAAIYKDFNPELAHSLPQEMREEFARYSADANSRTTETAPTTETEPTTETDQMAETEPAAETEPTTKTEPAAETVTQTGDETNSDIHVDADKPENPLTRRELMLLQQLERANQRYHTLQGKYNAEIRASRTNVKNDPSGSSSEDPTAADDGGTVADDPVRRKAEELGIDPDTAEYIRFVAQQQTNPLAERMSMAEARRFDDEIARRLAVRGMSFDTLDRQPMLEEYMTTAKNEDTGATALDDYRRALQDGNPDTAAAILANVERLMREGGDWLPIGEPARNAVAAPAATPVVSRQDSTEQAKQNPERRPPVVLPHTKAAPAADNSPNADALERELDAYTREMARGDFRNADKADKIITKIFQMRMK